MAFFSGFLFWFTYGDFLASFLSALTRGPWAIKAAIAPKPHRFSLMKYKPPIQTRRRLATWVSMVSRYGLCIVSIFSITHTTCQTSSTLSGSRCLSFSPSRRNFVALTIVFRVLNPPYSVTRVLLATEMGTRQTSWPSWTSLSTRSSASYRRISSSNLLTKCWSS